MLRSFVVTAFVCLVTMPLEAQIRYLQPVCGLGCPDQGLGPGRFFDCSFEESNIFRDWGGVGMVGDTTEFRDNWLLNPLRPVLPVIEADDNQAMFLEIGEGPDGPRPASAWAAAQGEGVDLTIYFDIPAAITGFYKLNPSGDAGASVSASVYEAGTYAPRGSGGVVLEPTLTPSWRPFFLPITPEGTADSTKLHRVTLTFNLTGNEPASVGSTLLIDNISYISRDPPYCGVTGIGPSAYRDLLLALWTAEAWFGDAELVALQGEPGLNPEWAYSFVSHLLSNKAQAARTFVFRGGQVVDEFDRDVAQLASLEPLPDLWIDSPAASAAVQPHAESFVAANPDAVAVASLSKGLVGSDPDRAVWLYEFSTASDTLRVAVDATDGDVVPTTIQEKPAPSPGPDLLAYPNPSSGEIRIMYNADRVGPATIAVYDLLGRHVRTLVHGIVDAGPQLTEWDGRSASGSHVSAGIYILHLHTAHAGVRTRPLMLVR